MNVKLQRYLRAAQQNLRYTYPAPMPKVSIICTTKRSDRIEALIDTIKSQTQKIDIVSFITQDYTEEQQQQLRFGITNGAVVFIEEIPSTDPITLGQRHNRAMEPIDSGIILVMDDDDIYFPNYVKGQVNFLLRTGASLVFKGDACVTNADQTRTGWILPFKVSAEPQVGAGGTMCFTKELYDELPFADVASGYDSMFMQQARLLMKNVRSSDPFNFAVLRGLDDHTWKDTKSMTSIGLRLNDVAIGDLRL